MKKTLLAFTFLLVSGLILAQDITGTWTGKLVIPQGELPLNINVSKDGAAYSSTLDSPAQNSYGIPVDSTFFENKVLTIVISAIQFRYEGKLTDSKNLKGKMTQYGQVFELDLVLKEEE